MTDFDCEKVRLAAMAISDGEESSLSALEIETHLANCAECRAEIESLGMVAGLLSSQKRISVQTDVWPVVNERLESSTASSSFKWRLLLLFGVPLFGYKGLLLILQTGPTLWLKLVPIIFVILIFLYLRVNPFKINSELTLGGELSS